MKKLSAVLLFFLIAACSGHSNSDVTGTGEIKLVVGDVKIEKNGNVKKAEIGDTFSIGDKIIAGEKSAAVASLNDGAAEFELQQNSVFVFNADKVVEIEKGNLWFRVNKKFAKGFQYQLKTPTAVAAVRGTKMYAFQMGDITGMCHCEGTVDYENKDDSYKHKHNRDNFVVTRNGVTALLTADDIDFIIKPGSEHKHSVLENSDLGQKSEYLSPEKEKRLMEVINRKLEEAAKNQ